MGIFLLLSFSYLLVDVRDEPLGRWRTLWSDRESETDYLNFGEVSQLAVDVLVSDDMLPVSIGVFGNWGAGKSSLLKLIEQKLDAGDQEWIIIKFDAWLYQGYDDARTALLEVIASELAKAAADDEGLVQKANKLLSRVDLFRAFGFVADGVATAFGIPTGGLLSRIGAAIQGSTDGIQSEEEYQELGNAAKEAYQQAGSLIKPEEKRSPPKQIDAFREEYGELLEALGKPLVVTIDNLDRCLPTNAIHTLEAIRLFLFLPNTAFVIAADEEMIRSSVASYFEGASQRHQIDYLDKLIQVPIRVPKAGIREVRSYLFMLYAQAYRLPGDKLEALRTGLEKELQESWKNDPISRQGALEFTGESEGGDLDKAFSRADRIAPILANSPIIQGNPRIVKRLLNVVKMRSQIARRRSMPLDEAIITKLVIFERCVGVEATADFYRLVDAEQGTPAILKQLEVKGEVIPEHAPSSWSDNPTTKAFILEWAQLEPKLSEVDLRPAIYLSRETIPLSAFSVGLSATGQEVLEILVETENLTSPTAAGLVKTIPLEEQVPVMEGVISRLRQHTNWAHKPKGFAGSVLLARHSPEAGKVLLQFIQGLEFGERRPPWMATMLKKDQWFKEE